MATEDDEDGSVIVDLGFDEFEPKEEGTSEVRMLHALNYIARAVGVLADAKIKEDLKHS